MLVSIFISLGSFNDGVVSTVSPPLQGRDGLVTPTISKRRAKLSARRKDAQLAVQTCIFAGQPDIFCIPA